MLVIELEKSVSRKILDIFCVMSLVADDPELDSGKVRVDKNQECQFEAVRESGEIRHSSIIYIEKSRIQGEEERDYQDFSETPDDIVPP